MAVCPRPEAWQGRRAERAKAVNSWYAKRLAIRPQLQARRPSNFNDSLVMTTPPYPRLGECVRALCIALDTKASNRDVDRLAREGDFDWERVDGVINDLLINGARRLLGPMAGEVFEPWLQLARADYCSLVLDVPLDAVDRRQALPVLIEGFFAPRALTLLEQLHGHCPGPGLGKLFDDGQNPLATVLEWLDEKAGGTIDKFLYPGTTGESKASRDKISKWRSGVDLPSGQGLKLLLDDLRADARIREHADAVGVWLLVARALGHFDQMALAPVRPLLRVRSETEGQGESVGQRLRHLVVEATAAWPEMADIGRRLWHDLQRTTEKDAGAQADTWDRIQALESLANALDTEGRSAYHLAWMKGRWHILAGKYEDALPHYEQAFELACYRAGHQVKEIVQDAICVAAFLGRKVFVKQLKQVGIVLGLFIRPGNDVAVESWELEQLAQQLFLRFPPQGRFRESEPDLSETPTPGFMTISMTEVDAIRPDLGKPDRVRAVRYGNGVVRRCPQLRLFASFGRATHVEALLDAGASVDELDSSGGSALLCAIQHAHDTGDRVVLDLLLRARHTVATLNAMTDRKRLTPLMCAIDLGEPDVVQKLLEVGADADQLALTDHQSPLYYTVTLIHGRVHPQRMFERLATAVVSKPDAVGRDTLRRFGVATAGAFGDDDTLLRAEPSLALETIKAMVDQHVRRYSVEKLRQIVALLLRFGADPNRGHRYPVPGRTPLMLAAESDIPAVFELMADHGGDPLKPDSNGKNCFHIAMAFRSHKVLEWLKRKGA